MNRFLCPFYRSKPRVRQRGWQVRKLINGYLRYLRDRKLGNSLALHEGAVQYGDTDEELDKWLVNLPLPPS
jgi:hypothetical protein